MVSVGLHTDWAHNFRMILAKDDRPRTMHAVPTATYSPRWCRSSSNATTNGASPN